MVTLCTDDLRSSCDRVRPVNLRLRQRRPVTAFTTALLASPLSQVRVTLIAQSEIPVKIVPSNRV